MSGRLVPFLFFAVLGIIFFKWGYSEIFVGEAVGLAAQSGVLVKADSPFLYWLSSYGNPPIFNGIDK